MDQTPHDQLQNNPQIIRQDGKTFVLMEIPNDNNFNSNNNNNNENNIFENETPFNTRQLRQKFLRKVYGILTVCILIAL